MPVCSISFLENAEKAVQLYNIKYCYAICSELNSVPHKFICTWDLRMRLDLELGSLHM